MRDGRAEAEAVDGAVVVGGDDLHPVVVARPGSDAGAEVDGAGKHEAVVVVGVLADQVHPPRRVHAQHGLDAEGSAEGFVGAFTRVHAISR